MTSRCGYYYPIGHRDLRRANGFLVMADDRVRLLPAVIIELLFKLKVTSMTVASVK
jgi:hypothetical protein